MWIILTIMISEEQKYIAEIFKIGGFALIAPLGKVILGIPYLTFEDLTIEFIMYFIQTLCFAIWGIILMRKGKELLREPW